MRPADLARLVLLAAIWGGSFLFVRMAVDAIGPQWLTELRVGLAAIAMLIYARAAGFDLNLAQNWRPYLVLGVLNTALPWGLYAWSGKYIGASYMAILNAAAPWFAAICGAIWLGEKLSWRKMLGLALGMLGVALLVGFGPIAVSAEVLLAVLACISATACYALAGVYVKKRASRIAPRALTVGSLIAASAVVMPFLPAPPAAAAFTWQVTLAALGISLLCSAAAYLIYFRLIADVGPTRTFTVTFLIPVFGTLWGALFLGEPVGMSTLAGGALIIAATALVLEIGMRRAARTGGLDLSG
jgi:drug/metabolite transporter (DMT)-like permease